MAEGDLPKDQLGKLLSLVEQLCTRNVIASLLREARNAGGQVRVAGTKQELTFVHLRAAIETGALSLERVYDVLRSAEENGSQHIFLYRARSSHLTKKYGQADAIASRLFGMNWEREMHFPQLHLLPRGVVWSDFRFDKPSDKLGAGWTAKLYAGIERVTLAEEREEGDRIIRIYERTTSREVFLIRWHEAGLLELRVPRDASSKGVISSLYDLWGSVKAAVDEKDFQPVDLARASGRLLSGYSPSVGYRLGSAHFTDRHRGSLQITPSSDSDDLLADPIRERAARVFDTCMELTVIWLPTSTNEIEDELRTVMGSVRPNDVLIPSRANAKAVDYVTDRLWQLTQ